MFKSALSRAQETTEANVLYSSVTGCIQLVKCLFSKDKKKSFRNFVLSFLKKQIRQFSQTFIFKCCFLFQIGFLFWNKTLHTHFNGRYFECHPNKYSGLWFLWSEISNLFVCRWVMISLTSARSVPPGSARTAAVLVIMWPVLSKQDYLYSQMA